MNINYYDLPKNKSLYNQIFEIDAIFNKFKIEENHSGEYISIQNVKYAVFFLTKKKMKKKELVKQLFKIRKENQKKEFLSKNFINEENHKNKFNINANYENLNYSYNLIEKSEFVCLIEKIISENKNALKISDYDILLEFYFNLATKEKLNKNFNYRKSFNEHEINLEKEIIENNVKITFEVFKQTVSELFPNVEEGLIKSCFDRLDIENQGFIKISAFESFFFVEKQLDK